SRRMARGSLRGRSSPQRMTLHFSGGSGRTLRSERRDGSCGNVPSRRKSQSIPGNRCKTISAGNSAIRKPGTSLELWRWRLSEKQLQNPSKKRMRMARMPSRKGRDPDLLLLNPASQAGQKMSLQKRLPGCGQRRKPVDLLLTFPIS
ncbi:terf2ip, partial [Symbiodinium pilosum]